MDFDGYARAFADRRFISTSVTTVCNNTYHGMTFMYVLSYRLSCPTVSRIEHVLLFDVNKRLLLTLPAAVFPGRQGRRSPISRILLKFPLIASLLRIGVLRVVVVHVHGFVIDITTTRCIHLTTSPFTEPHRLQTRV